MEKVMHPDVYVPPSLEIKFELEAKGRNIYRRRDNLEKLKTQLASREKFYGKFLLSNLSTSKFQLECGVSVPDDKRLFQLVSMSGALEELYYRGKTSFPKK
ncbi:hypothetical protein IGI04_011631 [Brassica rapa subsp. trilocularis]|uniref:Uncharacterized protein n=1 Tax=Brassica rapa subsp. trilocularis TaxID=1813537 RepID=A0ABQ7N3M5_BRACM|nr:hypothetical protein IGI04_011631 [Brassica rapa subsp. trilocularis]